MAKDKSKVKSKGKSKKGDRAKNVEQPKENKLISSYKSFYIKIEVNIFILIWDFSNYN